MKQIVSLNRGHLVRVTRGLSALATLGTFAAAVGTIALAEPPKKSTNRDPRKDPFEAASSDIVVPGNPTIEGSKPSTVHHFYQFRCFHLQAQIKAPTDDPTIYNHHIREANAICQGRGDKTLKDMWEKASKDGWENQVISIGTATESNGEASAATNILLHPYRMKCLPNGSREQIEIISEDTPQGNELATQAATFATNTCARRILDTPGACEKLIVDANQDTLEGLGDIGSAGRYIQSCMVRPSASKEQGCGDADTRFKESIAKLKSSLNDENAKLEELRKQSDAIKNDRKREAEYKALIQKEVDAGFITTRIEARIKLLEESQKAASASCAAVTDVAAKPNLPEPTEGSPAPAPLDATKAGP